MRYVNAKTALQMMLIPSRASHIKQKLMLNVGMIKRYDVVLPYGGSPYASLPLSVRHMSWFAI